MHRSATSVTLPRGAFRPGVEHAIRKHGPRVKGRRVGWAPDASAQSFGPLAADYPPAAKSEDRAGCAALHVDPARRSCSLGGSKRGVTISAAPGPAPREIAASVRSVCGLSAYGYRFGPCLSLRPVWSHCTHAKYGPGVSGLAGGTTCGCQPRPPHRGHRSSSGIGSWVLCVDIIGARLGGLDAGQTRNPCKSLGFRDGRYWARTSDLRLVEAALSQLS